MREKRRFRQYAICVLAYYRCEWTEVSDEDPEYDIRITREIRWLIRECWSRGVPAPNAAKELHIFFGLSGAIGETPPSEGDPGPKPK